jgi:hypothetical protein
MKLRHFLFGFPFVVVIALVGTSCAYEFKAKRGIAELSEKIARSAPVGARREQVEASLKSEEVPYYFSAPSNVIVSPRMPVGQFRLLWETQFLYQISFDQTGQVTKVITSSFNEGL